MKEIKLTQGKVALVDDDDYEYLSTFSWSAHLEMGTHWYAVARLKDKVVRMHRVLLKASGDLVVDHINGNGLDNRRANIRTCTRSQNDANRKKQTGLSSKFKGVCWNKRNNKWSAMIRVCGKIKNLGHFHEEKEAAAAYNKAAKEAFGEFAWLNDLTCGDEKPLPQTPLAGLKEVEDEQTY